MANQDPSNEKTVRIPAERIGDASAATMKIYFCDLCNESVPLTDLEQGKAQVLQGKIFCQKCNPALLARSTAAAGGQWIAWLALLAVVATAVFTFVETRSLDDRLGQTPRYDPQIADLNRSTEKLDQTLQMMQSSEGSLQQVVQKLTEDSTATRTTLQERSARLEQLEREVQNLQTLLEALRSDRELLQKLELRQTEISRSLSSMRETVASLEGRISGLTASVSSSPPVPDSAPSKSADFSERVQRLLTDLESRNASVRWSAVDSLHQERDRRLIPHLIPLLDDSDAFVQFRVISTLRDLNARSAVSKLIALLRDSDAIVREESLETLVVLTGNNQRFDVASGSSSDREKGIRAWEEWLQKNRDRYEGEAADS